MHVTMYLLLISLLSVNEADASVRTPTTTERYVLLLKPLKLSLTMIIPLCWEGLVQLTRITLQLMLTTGGLGAACGHSVGINCN